MRSYNIAVPGRSIHSNQSGFVDVSAPVAYRRNVVGSANVRGDRKHPNAFSFTIDASSSMVGSRLLFAKNGTFDLYEGPIDLPGWSVSPDRGFSNNAYNSALADLYGKIRGELDLSVDLIQYKQALSLTKKVLLISTKFGYFVSQVRHLKNPRTIASAWLEFQYGVKPLMSSVHDTLEAFTSPGQRWFRITGTGKDTSKGQRVSNITGTGIPTVETFERSKRCRFHCDYALSGSTLETMAGISSLNPVSIVWENIPYSFVVDWVYDVGGYVRNLESALLYSSSFVSGYYTETSQEIGTNVTVGVIPATDFVRGTSMNFKGSWVSAAKKRTVLSSSPAPRPPRIKTDLGSTRMLNAAALMGNLLKSFR